MRFLAHVVRTVLGKRARFYIHAERTFVTSTIICEDFSAVGHPFADAMAQIPQSLTFTLASPSGSVLLTSTSVPGASISMTFLSGSESVSVL